MRVREIESKGERENKESTIKRERENAVSPRKKGEREAISRNILLVGDYVIAPARARPACVRSVARACCDSRWRDPERGPQRTGDSGRCVRTRGGAGRALFELDLIHLGVGVGPEEDHL